MIDIDELVERQTIDRLAHKVLRLDSSLDFIDFSLSRSPLDGIATRVSTLSVFHFFSLFSSGWEKIPARFMLHGLHVEYSVGVLQWFVPYELKI